MDFLSGSKIRSAVQTLKTSRIAVAYVGKDWRGYIDLPALDELIVSPQLGSNPEAILEIAEEIGWGNVYLLEPLHAKFYLGSNQAIVGSFNLSRNGLSGENLYEAGFSTNNEKQIEKIEVYFGELRELAQNQYGTESEKEERISKLRLERSNAEASQVLKQRGSITSFSDYRVLSDQDFYVCWYREDYDGSLIINAEKVLGEIGGNSDLPFDSLIDDWTHFHPQDRIERNRWILFWPAEIHGSAPVQSVLPHWFYINDVVKDGISGPYSTLAIQRSQPLPQEPFTIDEQFAKALYTVLMRKEFTCMLDNPVSGTWKVKNTFSTFRTLIEAVKDECRPLLISRVRAAHPVRNNDSEGATGRDKLCIDAYSLLNLRINARHKLRNVRADVFEQFKAMCSMPEQDLGRVAMWACHLIQNQANLPLNHSVAEDAWATDEWIFERVGKNKRRENLKLLLSIIESSSYFSTDVRVACQRILASPTLAY